MVMKRVSFPIFIDLPGNCPLPHTHRHVRPERCEDLSQTFGLDDPSDSFHFRGEQEAENEILVKTCHHLMKWTDTPATDIHLLCTTKIFCIICTTSKNFVYNIYHQLAGFFWNFFFQFRFLWHPVLQPTPLWVSQRACSGFAKSKFEVLYFTILC